MYHDSSVQHQVVCGLEDVSRVGQVVVGVPVPAVAGLQSLHVLNQST